MTGLWIGGWMLIHRKPPLILRLLACSDANRGVGRGFEVVSPPVAHRVEDRFKRAAGFGERIVDPIRLLTDHRSIDEPCLFEIFETVREDFARNSIDVVLEFVESERADFQKSMEDNGMPFLSDRRRRKRNGTPFLPGTPRGGFSLSGHE